MVSRLIDSQWRRSRPVMASFAIPFMSLASGWSSTLVRVSPSLRYTANGSCPSDRAFVCSQAR